MTPFAERFRAGERPRLYLITDGSASAAGGADSLTGKIRDALDGGVRLVQLREKSLDGGPLLRLACRLRALTDEYGAGLIINDRADVSLLSGADGVHLGVKGLDPVDARRFLDGRGGAGMLIGSSTHGVAEARRAEAAGADFITLGPVYHTESKARYGEPVGPGVLREAASSAGLPVYAIGGMTEERVDEVISAGAYGIALISAVLASPDVRAAASGLLGRLERKRGPEGR